MGQKPLDVSAEKHGGEIISRTGRGEIRFLKVKGRAKGATTVTVIKTRSMAGLNQPERFSLAIVLVDGDTVEGPYNLGNPFDQEPGFGVTSINFELNPCWTGLKLHITRIILQKTLILCNN